MDNYKQGTVFQLYKDDDKEYMILNNVEKEGNIYLLVIPVYNVGKSSKTDYSKIMLLRVDKKTEDIEIETDENIIREVIKETIKSSK